MKIIQESKKEALPLDFITNLVGEGWEKIGNLRANIDAIKDAYSKTSKVADILQDLLDAYLIYVGRLESCVNNKDYLDLPDEKDLKEAFEVTDTADEEPAVIGQKTSEVEAGLPDFDVEVRQTGDSLSIDVEPKEEEAPFEAIDFTADSPQAPVVKDDFDDFIVDFDEPEITDNFKAEMDAWKRNNHNI